MVEAAISLSLFFAMLIVGIDLLILAYTSLSLQFVSTLAARDASLAEMQNAEVADRAVELGRRFGISLSRVQDIYMCPVRRYASCGNLGGDGGGFNQGQAGDLVALRVEANYNAIVLGRLARALSRRQIRLGKTVVMRREPNE